LLEHTQKAAFAWRLRQSIGAVFGLPWRN
jgi:hypothetical protein